MHMRVEVSQAYQFPTLSVSVRFRLPSRSSVAVGVVDGLGE